MTLADEARAHVEALGRPTGSTELGHLMGKASATIRTTLDREVGKGAWLKSDSGLYHPTDLQPFLLDDEEARIIRAYRTAKTEGSLK